MTGKQRAAQARAAEIAEAIAKLQAELDVLAAEGHGILDPKWFNIQTGYPLIVDGFSLGPHMTNRLEYLLDAAASLIEVGDLPTIVREFDELPEYAAAYAALIIRAIENLPEEWFIRDWVAVELAMRTRAVATS